MSLMNVPQKTWFYISKEKAVIHILAKNLRSRVAFFAYKMAFISSLILIPFSETISSLCVSSNAEILERNSAVQLEQILPELNNKTSEIPL